MAEFSDFGLNKDGFKFPVFSDYRSIMEAQGKIEYGENFVIDPETSLGQLLEIFCFMYEGMSNIYQNIYDSIFLYSMQGQMLDRYAGNLNISRLQGRKAYGNIELTGTANYLLGRGFEVKGQNGLFYTLVSNVLLDRAGKGLGQIVANETGSQYNTAINTVTEKATGNENITAVTNITAIDNGADIENDADFRDRLIRIFSGNESASVNGIKRAMLTLTQVRDCKVLENNKNIPDPATGLDPGEISVIIRGLIDDEVAEKLFNTRSAGIKTVGNMSLSVISDSNQLIEEHLYSATEKTLFVKVEDIQLYLGTSLDVVTIVKEQIMINISNTLLLGVKANYEKILAAVYNIEEIEEAKVTISIDNISYVSQDILISPFEYLNLKIENIEVVI